MSIKKKYTLRNTSPGMQRSLLQVLRPCHNQTRETEVIDTSLSTATRYAFEIAVSHWKMIATAFVERLYSSKLENVALHTFSYRSFQDKSLSEMYTTTCQATQLQCAYMEPI